MEPITAENPGAVTVPGFLLGGNRFPVYGVDAMDSSTTALPALSAPTDPAATTGALPALPSPAAPVTAATLAAENMVPEMNTPPSAAPLPAAPRNAPVSTAPVDYRGKRNKWGEVFDPDVHKICSDGRPYYDTKGHFRRKLLGRPRLDEQKRSHHAKPKETPDTPPPHVPEAPSGPAFTAFDAPAFNDGSPAGAAPGASPLPAPGGPDKYELAAEGFCKLGDAVMIRFFSEEIANSKDEHAALKTALAPALRESDIGDMPPWVAFSMVALAVYLPKFEKPTVKQRAAVLYLKVRGFFARTMGRFFGPRDGRPPVATAPKSERPPESATPPEEERDLPEGDETP